MAGFPGTLDEYKVLLVANVQNELERRCNAAVSDYTMRKGMRRAIQILQKGNGSSASEKTELTQWATTFGVLDPIESAAQAAKDRINALAAIPVGDDAFLLQW